MKQQVAEEQGQTGRAYGERQCRSGLVGDPPAFNAPVALMAVLLAAITLERDVARRQVENPRSP